MQFWWGTGRGWLDRTEPERWPFFSSSSSFFFGEDNELFTSLPQIGRTALVKLQRYRQRVPKKKQPPRRFPPPFLERPAGTQLEVAEERAAGRPLGSAVSTMQLRSQQCSATDSESISRKFIGVRRSRILLGFSLIHSHRFIGILPRLWSRFFLCCSLFSRGFFFSSYSSCSANKSTTREATRSALRRVHHSSSDGLELEKDNQNRFECCFGNEAHQAKSAAASDSPIIPVNHFVLKWSFILSKQATRSLKIWSARIILFLETQVEIKDSWSLKYNRITRKYME